MLSKLTPAKVPGDKDPVSASQIKPATKGIDRLNNLEQVTVENPPTGTWKAQVSYYSGSKGLLKKPQPYSLAGQFKQNIFFCDWNENPGHVYEIVKGQPQSIYKNGSGLIYHAAFSPQGNLYVSNANDFHLFLVSGNNSEKVYSHKTYLRDIAFDSEGRLYFSDATGGGGDGAVYRLDLQTNQATLFYRVVLNQVNGYWSGDFCFDRQDQLYLSSGNTSGAQIYRIMNPAAGSPPVKIYEDPNGAISGIAFNRNNDLYYSDWKNNNGLIYMIDLSNNKRWLVYSFPNRTIWDVAFR